MDNVHFLVQVLEAEDYLSGHESCLFQAKFLQQLYVKSQIASLDVLKTKVKVSIVLEGGVEFDHERAFACGQNLSLRQHLVQSSMANLELRLEDCLYSEELVVLPVFGKEDFPETSYS